MKRIKELAEACKGVYLRVTNLSQYVLQKAKKESWSGIEIFLKPFYTLCNGEMAGYSVIVRDIEQIGKQYELYVVPGTKSVKVKKPNGEVVVKESDVLNNTVDLLNALYYIRDKFLPEAVKKQIKTVPDLPLVHYQIEGLESKLKEYL